MGASTSTPVTNDNIANVNSDKLSMEIVLDKGVKSQIDKLSEYVSMFNSNDVKPLLQVIDDYKINLETSTGKKYELNNVKTFVGKFHQELLDKIAKDFPTMTEQEKQLKLSEKLKDKTLPDYLKNIYDNKLGELRGEVMKSPIVAKDAKMTQSIDRIFTDITGLKAKYKYFEYKYIQLNLFLIVFIQHTYTTMDNFINTVLAYTVSRDTSRSDALRELINLLLEIMKQAELNIDQKDFDSIEQLMSVVEGSIKEKQVALGQAVEKARVEALDEMLKLVMAHHDMFSDKAAQDFASPNNDNEFFQNFTVRQTPVGSKQPQNVRSRPSQETVLPPDNNAEPRGSQFGGFVRDHSQFPQAFYKL